VRVYEAIVKGLESIEAEAAFGDAGENAAQLLLALKHSHKVTGIVARHAQAASLNDFEDAFAKALASHRPSVIDAHITRGAISHYSPSPDGVIKGIVELVEERLRNR
jgi:thiamine pyrophosphate-dependent acetolactate synthase large subunit-like protein